MDNHEDASRKNASPLKPMDYLRGVKVSLRAGKQKAAFIILQQAVVQYPDDPFVLSYYGCMQAIVDKKYRTGVENCRKALALFKKQDASDKELLYPLFFLNLGRAYVAAGKKKDAIEVYTSGLKYDSSHSELLREMKNLGTRKKPVVPFLDRSNPVNKYIGLLLHPAPKQKAK